MRQQSRFSKDQFAHCFEIVQSRVEAEPSQRFPHLGKDHLWLVAQRKQGLRAAEFLSGLGHSKYFIRRHGVGAGITRIAAESAIAAIVAAEIRKWDEDFARVGNNPRLEPVSKFPCCEQ